MSRQHPIDFVNPTFHEGLNITVRHGDKWARTASIGDVLQIEGHAGRITAPITGLLRCLLDEIPEGLLALEHDAEARSRDGLRRILDEIYGPTEDGRRDVTVIFFSIA
ncbi:hypothetical protein [Oceaniglobus roseus]|uniref:hypothetical protein n=1 Tax=Oceaniglobus roseus TaxID=1737570 RepID=UPI000C7EF313|nr:hypothetical protein [Kandeliimicrobium roseum]